MFSEPIVADFRPEACCFSSSIWLGELEVGEVEFFEYSPLILFLDFLRVPDPAGTLYNT